MNRDKFLDKMRNTLCFNDYVELKKYFNELEKDFKIVIDEEHITLKGYKQKIVYCNQDEIIVLKHNISHYQSDLMFKISNNKIEQFKLFNQK